MDDARPNRRRFSISLRALTLLILILGLWLGWRVNRAREQRLAVEAIREYGGFVHYDWEYVDGKLTSGKQPPGPKWLRRLLGDEYFQEIACVNLVYDDSTGKRFETVRTDGGILAHLRGMSGLKELLLHDGQATDPGLANLRGLTSLEKIYIWDAQELTDAGVAHLKGLPNLTYIHINDSRMTDRGLEDLASLPRLEGLSLQGHRFTDAGLRQIRGLTNLKSLHVGLGRGEITDGGLAHLAGLRCLETLDIQGSLVTDRGLEHLKTLPNLKELWIGGETAITAEGLGRLKQAKPNLRTL